jgi:hydroxypyruvate isomerase
MTNNREEGTMPRFAANLTTLFTEVPVLERFARARAAGFRHAELLFPYDTGVEAVAEAARAHDIQLVLFNIAAGNRAAGDRGIASHPARRDEFRQEVLRAIEWAKTLDCPRMHCMSGLSLDDISRQQQWATLVENGRFAGEVCAQHGLTLLFEPLNDRDNPGYFFVGSAMALRLVDEIGLPNVKFQYDIYHMQRGEGELALTIERNLDRIGHIQIADNPGRHQPGTGEINYPFLFAHLDRIGYDGFVSLEYNPLGTTEESLGWIAEYL